jgi:hypothetical protein
MLLCLLWCMMMICRLRFAIAPPARLCLDLYTFGDEWQNMTPPLATEPAPSSTRTNLATDATAAADSPLAAPLPAVQ